MFSSTERSSAGDTRLSFCLKSSYHTHSMRICRKVLSSPHSHSWESCGIWNLSNHSLLEPWPVRSRVMMLKMWRDSFRMICLVIKSGTVKLNWASGTMLRYHSCLPLSPVLYWFFHFFCSFSAFVCFTTLVCNQKFSHFQISHFNNNNNNIFLPSQLAYSKTI